MLESTKGTTENTIVNTSNNSFIREEKHYGKAKNEFWL